MQLTVISKGIIIKPEDFQDKAFVENSMGLRNDGDSVILRRQNLREYTLTGVVEDNYILIARQEDRKSNEEKIEKTANDT